MSSYFDEAQREVRQDFTRIVEVEARVKRDVLLVAGDIDTPEGTREILVGTIALWEYETSYKGPPTKGREHSDVMRQSALIQNLHSQFHGIASCKIQTRFGILNDNPRHILAMRDAYVEGQAEPSEPKAKPTEPTPEPWSIELTGDNQAELLPAGYLISFGGGRTDDEPEYDPQALVDAALIVASPQLLRALVFCMLTLGAVGGFTAAERDRAIALAQEAIAEARKIPVKKPE